MPQFKKEKMIEYIDKEHLYLYDGVIIPSVSDILKYIFPDKYKGIDLSIIQNKALYGTKLHEMIQSIDEGIFVQSRGLKLCLRASLEQYEIIKNDNSIKILSQEQIVCYNGIYAGRYDKEAMVNDELALIDIKTTAQLDKEYLSWQLSFYELASGKKYDKLYVIWLPKKEKGKIIEIERKSKKELLDILEKMKE